MESLPDTTVVPTFYAANGSPPTALSKAATTGVTWVIDWIKVSFSGDPSGTPASLVVAVGGSTVLDVDITTTNPPMLDFSEHGLYGDVGDAMSVTLGDSDALTGYLNVKYH